MLDNITPNFWLFIAIPVAVLATAGLAIARIRRLRRDAERFEAWCKTRPNMTEISAEDFHDNAALSAEIISQWQNPETVLSIKALPLQLQDLLSDREQEFGHIEIVGDGRNVILKRAKIWVLEVKSVGELFFDECEIGVLAVHYTASYGIENSKIGKFVVLREMGSQKTGFHVQNLTWKGGYLGQFDLHQEKTSAFVGDVSFDRITLPPTDEHHGIQWLRDAREALNARSNFVAAGIFHASELKLTRPKGWRKIFSAYWWTSLVYQAGSDFGNSIGRPLVWFIGTMLSLGALSYLLGTRVARKGQELHGWQTALNCDEYLRAAQYAVQSINPLNLFGSPLVVMSNKWGAIAGGFLGVIGIAAFALLLLSVRRRFKLE